MALNPTPATCERSRAWISVRLDEELSELEEALLGAHLRSCAVCSEYEESVRGVVLAVRAQPLEQVEHPVVVAGRRRIGVRPIALARVAAAVAVVAGVTAVLGTESARHPAAGRLPAAVSAAADEGDLDVRQLRALRVIQLGGRPPRGSGVGQFGAVLDRHP